MTEWAQNPLMILWGGEKVFFLLFSILKCDSPLPLDFLALHPFVCVCVCVVISPNAVPGPLGQQPCLALWLWKASAQPKRSRHFMVTTLFLLHASCRLLCPGDAAPDKRLFSCFGAAVVPGGYSCCRGTVGEDAGRLGRAASAGMLAAFHPLCSRLSTSARSNQRKRICTP